MRICMFQNLALLLLPAIIPSWRFFDGIAPSPRIEFAVLEHGEGAPDHWQEFRPRPAAISLFGMLRRLFWNAEWNESLFLVSCAERLIEEPTQHSQDEIIERIRADLARRGVAAAFLQFRLVFIARHGAELKKEITYISPVHSCEGMGA